MRKIMEKLIGCLFVVSIASLGMGLLWLFALGVQDLFARGLSLETLIAFGLIGSLFSVCLHGIFIGK